MQACRQALFSATTKLSLLFCPWFNYLLHGASDDSTVAATGCNKVFLRCSMPTLQPVITYRHALASRSYIEIHSQLPTSLAPAKTVNRHIIACAVCSTETTEAIIQTVENTAVCWIDCSLYRTLINCRRSKMRRIFCIGFVSDVCSKVTSRLIGELVYKSLNNNFKSKSSEICIQVRLLCLSPDWSFLRPWSHRPTRLGQYDHSYNSTQLSRTSWVELSRLG